MNIQPLVTGSDCAEGVPQVQPGIEMCHRQGSVVDCGKEKIVKHRRPKDAMVQVGRTHRDLCGSLFLRVQWLDCIDVVGVDIIARKVNDCPFLTTHVGVWCLVCSFERPVGI